ncbi:unnamed protein product [Alopecurus aequalis]
MATTMGARGGVATWCCLLVAALALGSVMGQDEELPNLAVPPPSPGNGDVPPSPSNWFWDVPPSWDGTPPVSQVPSYQNGHPFPVDYNKPNRIFICDDDFGKTCVTQCPDECPVARCQMSCSYCETWCGCVPAPGVTCGDPSFTGGDGVTFYFHGKRNKDFCIVSDHDLHINAHFISNYNPSNERTFTWIQALGVIFGDHQLYLGARKAVEWDEEDDHIQITFDGEPVSIDTVNKARWVSKIPTGLSVERTNTVNSVVVDLAGVFKITASAVPITEEDSKIHNYGRTTKDSLMHLDLRFKFYSLTNVVDGVLGQTYQPDYVNKLNVTAKMPIMGGTPNYLSSGLFSTDCAVSKFHRGNGANHVHVLSA